MEIARLIAALSDPSSYANSVDEVEVRQTHISAVFLAGQFAYKVKKPVELGFVDYRTLDRRRHFCEREVRLNRRLAPEVYLGVVPVTRAGEAVAMEGRGEAVEWAVKMARLPDDATLDFRLRRGELGAARMAELARRIAEFHHRAEGGEAIAAFGRFEVVAGNARENLDQETPRVGLTISATAHERLRALTERALAGLRSLIEGRARRGVPRDTHGDLRLGHAYHFPDRTPPADWVVIDCVEFSERFRYADPVADAAFPVMELIASGRRDLARAFADAYFEASADEEGRALLPFYTSYRAAVRAKVEGLKLAEPEVPEGERSAALERARALWLLALGELEEPGRRPALILVGGLPGTGKSTLARALAARAGFETIRSDVVRKELAGLAADEPARDAFGEGIYTPEWTERTYAECLRRAVAMLFDGRRVAVDASFIADEDRRRFLDLAGRRAVPAAILLCRSDPGVVKARLEARRGDASDADWAIYSQATLRWEEPGPEVRPSCREIDTGGDPDRALQVALVALAEVGLSRDDDR